MARSQETFSKKEKEKKKLKKRQEKAIKKEERKANASGGDFENMIAYVDENGHLTDTPPDLSKKKKVVAANIEIGVPKREDVEIETVKKGVVEFYNDQKGFGFIIDDQSGEKYFFHVNGTLEDVFENDKVSFELEQGMKGINAVKVKKY